MASAEVTRKATSPLFRRPPTVREQPLVEPDGLQDTLQQLELALAAATPFREYEWLARVLEELSEVRMHLARHSPTEVPDHFLGDLDLAGPGQVRQGMKLWREHAELLTQARMLLILAEMEAEDRTANFSHIRRRVELLLEALRDHQARETDLVLDSFCTDIGTGD